MSTVTNMTTEQYNQYLNEGYTLHLSQITNHQAYVGRSVILRKQLGTCESIARAIGCILVAPLGCLTFLCCSDTVGECIQCSAEVLDGYHTEKGFIQDEEATRKLRNEDYRALNIEVENFKPSVKKYVLEQYNKGNPPIHSADFPQHSYMSIYGPISKFSYIIVIPNNNYDDMSVYPVSNDEGDPCNAQELKKKAFKLCGGWREGVKKILTVTSNVPIGHSTTNTVYGSFQSTTYQKIEQIKSSTTT